VWHKGCFKCQVCGMTLNMKNYKGFEKKPYCGAHYPQPKTYTFVSDNPEMQRVKQNTAVISNVQYHSDFEKAKGRYTAVTDDPESLRHRQNAQVVSNRCYRALYAYAASDTDEVSFNEGDLITNGDPIDEGWMYGRVERTGEFGMLPANYVSAV
uniref:LIM zinc-binding domain-containing Nebulette n=1 Tax=Macrostomum lignano TaxID=282301 RepID=A0A1I8GPW7_9PLAT